MSYNFLLMETSTGFSAQDAKLHFTRSLCPAGFGLQFPAPGCPSPRGTGAQRPATGTPRGAYHSCPAHRTCRPRPPPALTLRPRRATLPERWSLAVAPRGGVRASCGRAASGLRGGARISHAKLIPPRHAGRPPARGCAVLGGAAVSSPLRPLRRGVPCGAGHPASSTPLTCQLSSRAEGRSAGPRTLTTPPLRPARAARCGARGPASRGAGAQPYSGLGRRLHADRSVADRSSPLVLQPV